VISVQVIANPEAVASSRNRTGWNHSTPDFSVSLLDMLVVLLRLLVEDPSTGLTKVTGLDPVFPQWLTDRLRNHEASKYAVNVNSAR